MRASNTDLMQGFRYHVTAKNSQGADLLQPADRTGFEGGGQAGFQSVTVPELSVEPVEYREGTFKWTQKYPGVPSVSDITLMRGVAKNDTVFYDMVMASIEGKEYRSDVVIWHYQRDQMDIINTAERFDSNVRRIEAKEAIATRAKPNGDLDSTSGDISLAEVDLAIESFVVSYK